MAEVLRIDIELGVNDNTGAALARATRNVSAFEETVRRTEQHLQRMNRTRWQLTLSALDRASPIIGRVGSSLRNITGRTWQITMSVATAPLRALDWVWNRLTSIRTLVTAFLAGQAFRQGILGPLALESRLQRARIGFETFLGSARRAQQFIGEIQQFAAETPFEMPELLDWSVQLMPVFRGNTEMVLRTLRAFGDAAAMTGAGVEGMSLALLGFRQIATMGRLQMEELRQVTENLLIPLEPVLEELGLAQEDLKELGKKGIPAARAMEAILRALERPVERGGFLGGMSRQMATLENQVARLRDNLTMRFVQPWGRGLASGVAAALGRVSDWFERNQTTVERWSQKIEQAGRLLGDWFAQRVERFFARLQSLVADPTALAEPPVLSRGRLAAMEAERRDYVERLVRAMNPEGDLVAANRALRRAMETGPQAPETQRQLPLGEQLSRIWDRLIVEPFDAWWNSRGQEQLRLIAEKIGGFLGAAVNGAILAALGVAAGDGAGSEYATAGGAAGQAFWQAFVAQIDTNQIAEKLGQALKNMAWNVATLAPGGDPETAGDWVSLFVLGWLGTQAYRILDRWLLRPGRWVLGKIRGRGAAGVAGTAEGAVAAEAAAAAEAAGARGLLARLPWLSRLAPHLSRLLPVVSRFAPWLMVAWLGWEFISKAREAASPDVQRAMELAKAQPAVPGHGSSANLTRVRLQEIEAATLEAQAARIPRMPSDGEIPVMNRARWRAFEAARARGEGEQKVEVPVTVHTRQGPMVQVSPGAVSVTFNVTVHEADGEQVVNEIRRNSRAIADELADNVAMRLYRQIVTSRANMPTVRVPRAGGHYVLP